MAFSWLNFLSARQQLAGLLADPGMVRWTDAELKLYIVEALRVWNCLTFSFTTDYALSIAAGAPNTWMSLGSLANSPRLRTVLDTDVYTLMQYHLGEPPTGGAWTGTSQFTITDLSQALRRYRDEIMQETACNIVDITVAAPLGVSQVVLPDTVLDIIRARWVPLTATGITPVTLWRTDHMAEQAYDVDFAQQSPGTPSDYVLQFGESPQFSTDVGPNVPGNFDLLTLQSGTPLTPPSSTLLNIPDDFAWVAKFGALASNLGRESEATDRDRALYCEQRYKDGLKLMQNTPWIQLAKINGVPVDTPSALEMDGYSAEWDSAATLPYSVVIAGMDSFLVTAPTGQPVGVTLSVLGNAPVPVADSDFVQVSRDVWERILDYAHFLALFKLGGYEFTQAREFEKAFILAAAQVNSRLRRLGIFSDVLLTQSKRENVDRPRYKEESNA